MAHISARRLWLVTLLSLLLVSLLSAYVQAADPNAGPQPGNGNTNNGGNTNNNNNNNNNNQQQQQNGNTNNANDNAANGNNANGNTANGNNANGNNANGNNANGNQAQAQQAATSTIPDSAPIGGVTVTQPAETAQASYYKIAPNAPVTFGWNFTYVLQTPKTLLVNAVCTKNGNTYSLAGPTGLPGTATNFTWDPYSYYQNAPASGLPALIQATYRLVISDPEVTANGPGLMAANSKVQFALYIPQPYTPLASFICVDCSGAAGLRSLPPAVLAMIATFTAMLAGGYGLLARGAGGEADE